MSEVIKTELHMKYFIFNMELLNNNGLVFQFRFKCIKNSIQSCSRINNVIITIIYLCMYLFNYLFIYLFGWL